METPYPPDAWRVSARRHFRRAYTSARQAAVALAHLLASRRLADPESRQRIHRKAAIGDEVSRARDSCASVAQMPGARPASFAAYSFLTTDASSHARSSRLSLERSRQTLLRGFPSASLTRCGCDAACWGDATSNGMVGCAMLAARTACRLMGLAHCTARFPRARR